MMKSAVVLVAIAATTDVALSQTSFAADNAIAAGVTGTGDAVPGVANAAADEVAQDDAVLEVQMLLPSRLLLRVCECVDATSVETSDIRGISDTWASNGNTVSSTGMSNMVWSFGQFVDHDLTLTIEDESGPTFLVGSNADDMTLHRAVSVSVSSCPTFLNVHTPQLDAGAIYGTQASYLTSTLRAPGSCNMRVSEGNQLPLTTNADEDGLFRFIAGDVRVSEHAFLAAQHTVWLREHNRLCAEIENDPDFASASADAKFDLVRTIITSKYQKVILEEFLPALGITESDLQSAARLINRPDVSAEFSIAYRLGHDLIPNIVGSIAIADSFNAENFLLDQGGTPSAPTVTFKTDAETRITNMLTGLATESANEIDGRLSDALRNLLFGAAEEEDLAGRNIFRGRELGIPTYGALATCYGTTADTQVEMDTPDAWLGLLREPKGTAPLPPTLREIILEQFGRSFFGPGGLFWRRFVPDLGKFLPEVEASTYATIISTNTDAAVTGNVFSA